MIAYLLSRQRISETCITTTDAGFVLSLPSCSKANLPAIIGSIREENCEQLLFRSLQNTSLLKSVFRINATRSFMILKSYKGRQKSARRQQLDADMLIGFAGRLDEFAVLRESFREIIEDRFERKPEPSSVWSASVASRAAASSVSASAERVEQVGVGALARAADAAADLVELREAELVGALDDQRVGLRDVDARLDDRRRHQARRRRRAGRRASSPPARSRPSGRGRRRSARPGHSARSRSAVSSIVSTRLCRKNAWPLALVLALDRLAHQLLVVLADVGADRAPALGRRLDHRDVAQPGEATSAACAGSASPSSASTSTLSLSWRSSSFCLTPKRCSSSTIEQAEVLGADVAREQPVGADQDVDLARRRSRRAPALTSAGGRKRRDHLDREREVARGARGRCRSAAGRGSSSAPGPSPACRRRRP